jgi:hypothetical protein
MQFILWLSMMGSCVDRYRIECYSILVFLSCSLPCLHAFENMLHVVVVVVVVDLLLLLLLLLNQYSD